MYTILFASIILVLFLGLNYHAQKIENLCFLKAQESPVAF